MSRNDIQVRVPPELKETLQALADADDRSLSSMSRIALEEYVANHQAKSNTEES